MKQGDTFLLFAHNINVLYFLDKRSMFKSKNKNKKMYTCVNPVKPVKAPSNFILLTVPRRDVAFYVACFGVSVCTVSRWHLVRFKELSGHLLGKSCSFG